MRVAMCEEDVLLFCCQTATAAAENTACGESEPEMQRRRTTFGWINDKLTILMSKYIFYILICCK